MCRLLFVSIKLRIYFFFHCEMAIYPLVVALFIDYLYTEILWTFIGRITWLGHEGNPPSLPISSFHYVLSMSSSYSSLYNNNKLD